MPVALKKSFIRMMVALTLTGWLCFAWADAQPANALQDAFRPDVHLTFDIEPDGSNMFYVEVAFHPLLDPLLREALALVESQLPTEDDREFDLIETKRDGRTFSALAIGFESLGDLNAFINTPQMLSGLLGTLAPGLEAPLLFDGFQIEREESAEGRFVAQAAMPPTTTAALQIFDMAVHIRLPYGIEHHNAGRLKQGELTWKVVPGEPLEIAATTRSASLFNSISSRSNRLILPIGTVLLILIIAVVGFWLYRRSRKQDEWSQMGW